MIELQAEMVPWQHMRLPETRTESIVFANSNKLPIFSEIK